MLGQHSNKKYLSSKEMEKKNIEDVPLNVQFHQVYIFKKVGMGQIGLDYKKKSHALRYP